MAEARTATEEMTVRLATWRDESALYDLLVAMHRNLNNGWQVNYRPELVLRQIERGTRPDPATRTDPNDKARGLIGVIGAEGERLVGTIGLYLDALSWFSDSYALVELFLFVRREHRIGTRHEQDLFDFARQQHAALKAGLPKGCPERLPLLTGFQHQGERYEAMERLWRRRCGGRKIGTLFQVD